MPLVWGGAAGWELHRITFMSHRFQVTNIEGQELISTSKQIHSVLLQMSGNKTGEMCVCTPFLKKRISPIKEYKLLLVGETGSGKTSFLNLICNTAVIQSNFDYKLDSFQDFNDIQLENAASQPMQSKTSGAKLYKAKLCGLSLGIIDTPGFGDSRGIEQDKENIQKVISCIKEEKYINCVCLVINGRLSRNTADLKYVLTQIASILPRAISNNLIVVFTNTAKEFDLNFDLDELNNTYFGKQIDTDRVAFCIENPYCILDKARKRRGQISDDKIVEKLKKSFEETAEVLKEMCSAMKGYKNIQIHEHMNSFHQEFRQESKKEWPLCHLICLLIIIIILLSFAFSLIYIFIANA